MSSTRRTVVSPAPAGVSPAAPLLSGRPLDWLLFGLAMVSLGLLIWLNFFTTTHGDRQVIRAVDYTVCSIFAGEFLWRWYLNRWSLRYLTRNWYAVLGMIPVAQHYMLYHPVWRAVLIAARFGRAIDRVLGDGFTYRLINRVKDPIVGAISGAITIAMLDRVADVLAKGTYTENIARALADNEANLRVMVMEKLKADPQIGRLSRLPYHDVIVQSVISAVLRVTEDVLKDPRTDALVADMLRENLEQLRAAVAEQEAAKESLFRQIGHAVQTPPE
jgi:hypothetical protein